MIMAADARVGTFGYTGTAWGARARDWALVQEDQSLVLYDAILARLPLKRGTRLLDVACGAGRFCQLASMTGAAVTGIDLSPSMIAVAHGRVPAGTFRVGPLQALPFPNERFAVVTAINALQYCADPLSALREARRVTQAGGTVVLAAWSDEGVCDVQLPLAAVDGLLPVDTQRAPGPLGLAADGSLETLAMRAGLTPTDAADICCDWFYADHETALRAFLSMGPSVYAMRYVGEAVVRACVSDALSPFRTEAGTYVLRNTARYVVTHA